MPGHGGARPGAGRPKGSREAATKEQQATIAELARSHAPDALAALVKIATKGESESAVVAAANSILDRAYGRPTQAMEISGPSKGPLQVIDPSRMSTDALRELMGAMIDADSDPDQGGPAGD